jgi:hypothetical protein
MLLFYFITKMSISNYSKTNDLESRLDIASLFSVILAFMVTSTYGNPHGWMFWLFLGLMAKTPDFKQRSSDVGNKMVGGSIILGCVGRALRYSMLADIMTIKKGGILSKVAGGSKVFSMSRKIISIIRDSKSLNLIGRIID